MKTTSPIPASLSREITMSRVFDAPRELVFEVTNNPIHVPKWWGCGEYPMTVCEIDFRVGGAWRYAMQSPEGIEYRFKGIYQEIERPIRVVHTQIFDMEPHQDDEALVTVLYDDDNGKTTLTTTIRFATDEIYEGAVQSGMEAGMNLAFDRLATVVNQLKGEETSTPHTANSGEFVMTRVFDAPRDLVYRVWTQPEHLVHWWGPQGFSVKKAEIDLRPQGIFHYCLAAPDGQEMWGKWTFTEVVAPQKLVFLSAFSDSEANVVRAPFSEHWPLEVYSTIFFAEHEGKTTLTMRSYPWNANEDERQAFNAMIPSMQGGWTGTLNALTTYLSSI